MDEWLWRAIQSTWHILVEQMKRPPWNWKDLCPPEAPPADHGRPEVVVGLFSRCASLPSIFTSPPLVLHHILLLNVSLLSSTTADHGSHLFLCLPTSQAFSCLQPFAYILPLAEESPLLLLVVQMTSAHVTSPGHPLWKNFPILTPTICSISHYPFLKNLFIVICPSY